MLRCGLSPPSDQTLATTVKLDPISQQLPRPPVDAGDPDREAGLGEAAQAAVRRPGGRPPQEEGRVPRQDEPHHITPQVISTSKKIEVA